MRGWRLIFLVLLLATYLSQLLPGVSTYNPTTTQKAQAASLPTTVTVSGTTIVDDNGTYTLNSGLDKNGHHYWTNSNGSRGIYWASTLGKWVIGSNDPNGNLAVDFTAGNSNEAAGPAVASSWSANSGGSVPTVVAGNTTTGGTGGTTNTTTSTPANFSVTQLTDWVKQFPGSNISITVPPQTSSPYNPPNVSSAITTTDAGAPSTITFKLSDSYAESNAVVSAHVWLIFQGYAEGGAFTTSTAIPGLYFVTGTAGDATSQYGYFLSTSGAASATTLVTNVNGGSGGVTNLLGNNNTRSVTQSSVNNVMDYVMNVPLVSSIATNGAAARNCNAGTLYLTGPNPAYPATRQTSDPGTNFVADKTVTAIESTEDNTKYGYTTATTKPFDLNPNCLATASSSPNGWMAAWGVASTDVTGSTGGACSLGTFVTNFAIQGIGSIVTTVVGCIFNYIIEAIVSQIDSILEPLAKLQTFNYEHGQQISNTFSISLVPHAYATSDTLEGYLSDTHGPIYTVWNTARSMVDVIVILALFAIAFANILHININTYAAKKALPNLVIGVILANASWFIVRFLADVAQALSWWAVNLANASSISGLIVSVISTSLGAIVKALIANLLPTVAAAALAIFTSPLSGPLLLVISVVFLIYYLFLIISFTWLLLKRVVIIFFLIMAAPLAMVAYGIPTFEKYFYQWWNNFLKYLFMFPIILFGIAAVDLLEQSLGFRPQVASLPDLSGMLLVMIGLNLVLKIPATITKGALTAFDAGATFKKAIASLPGLVVAGGVGYDAYKNGAHRDLGNSLASGGVFTSAGRSHFAAAGKKFKDASFNVGDHDDYKRVRQAQGALTIVANPQMAWDAYKERQAGGKSNDTREASMFDAFGTVEGGVLNTIKGPDQALSAALKFREDQTKDYLTPEQFQRTLKINPTTLNTSKLPDWAVDHYVALGTPEEKLKFQGEITAIRNDKTRRDFLTANPSAPQDAGDDDIARMKAYFAGAVKIGRQNRNTNPAARVTNQESFFAFGGPNIPPNNPPGGGGGGAPTGGPAPVSPMGGPSVSPAPGTTVLSKQDLDNSIKQIVDTTDNQTLVNAVTKAGRGETSELGRILNSHIDKMSDTFGKISNEDKEKFLTHLGSNVSKLSNGADMADVLKKSLGDVHEAGFSRLGSTQAASNPLKQELDKSTSDIIASIDEESLSRAIADASRGQTEDFAKIMGGHLKTLSSKFGQVNPKDQDKFLQSLASHINTSSNKLVNSINGTANKKSMVSVLKSTLGELNNSLASGQQNMNTALSHIANSPTVINQSVGSAPSQVTSNTNFQQVINNLEQPKIDSSNVASSSAAAPPEQFVQAAKEVPTKIFEEPIPDSSPLNNPIKPGNYSDNNPTKE